MSRKASLSTTVGVGLMMEAVSTYETSIDFYKTKRRNIPEDSHLRTRRRKDLKSHSVNFYGYVTLRQVR
jgi:hypothetical protein